MKIHVRVIATPVFEELGPHGPGHRTAFSNDLRVESVNNKTPGHGLPKSKKKRLAGTRSGFVTTLRIAAKNDPFFPKDSYLFQYEGTYKFNAVPITGGPALPKGQIVAQGVFVVDKNFQPLEQIMFAIVGGTETYSRAHGLVTELPNGMRELDVQ